MMEKKILVRYGEIFLKSEPVRKILEKKLVKNIKEFLKKENVKFKIERERGRIFVKTKEIEKVSEILKRVFGIVSFSPCFHLKTASLKKIQEFCKKNYKNWIAKNESFAIRVRRVGKHKFTSQEVAEAVGKIINRKVDLKNPEKEIFIEIRNNNTYIYTKILKAEGGLPVGSEGKVLSLISGGIDSPVSSWLAMKRGCKVIFVHFHSFPLVSKTSIYKTRELVKILSNYQGKSKVYFLPFSKLQMYLKARVPPKDLIIFYRRFMLRIAEEIAKRENANAIVTGESLGQVSSQTLQNLGVIEEVCKLPILRPLIGMDKNEIIALAKKIGTYEISIRPQEDCCTLFVPKHPTTRAKISRIKKFEKKLKIKKLVNEVLKGAEIEKI
jgi:thiamine biosynthesis protein ThiI